MVFGIIRAIAVILFLYLSWKSLRENYKEESLIPFLWGAVLVFLVVGRITFGLMHWGVWNENIMDWFLVWQKPGFEYLGAMMGMIGAIALMAKYNEWKTMAVLEDMTWVSLLMLSLFLADEFIRGRFDIKYGISLIIVALGLMGSLWIKKKYRSFVWYTTGKKGFVFYFTAALIFALFSGLSFLLKQGLIIQILYLVLSLLSLLGLFILGEVLNPLLVKLKRK